MNPQEAKSILIRYRPDLADALEPEVAEALALAKTNPELGLWLKAQGEWQAAVRERFRQIAPPAGLMEQILSEHAASRRSPLPQLTRRLAWAALAVVLMGTLAYWWFPRRSLPPENSLAFYQQEMVSLALRGYAMDLVTNELTPIRDHLARNDAPAQINLPGPLKKAPVVGCGVESWQGAKISMICFRTGKPLPPGMAADLWLFVVDRSAIKDPPAISTLDFAGVNRLITATWTDGDKLYFLGVQGGRADLEKYL